MNGERRHTLEIGDRVIARTNHCGPRPKHRATPQEHIGVIIRIEGNKAVVDCDGQELERNLGQLEFFPYPDEYEQRKLEVRIQHAWKKRKEKHDAG